MLSANTQVRREALHRAYYAVDEDLERLRFLLGVPILALYDWLAGRTPAPLAVFLRAVDVIVEAKAVARGAGTRTGA